MNDPLFTELQLSLAVKNPGHLYTLKRDSNLYFADKPLDTTVGNGMKRSLEWDWDWEWYKRLKTTVGIKLPGEWYSGNNYASCQSLMCYQKTNRSIYVCNPITGDRVKLLSQHLANSICGSWGFGYAPLSKKYKCVQLLRKRIHPKPKGRNSFKCRSTAEVFTLGGESWRELGHIPLDMNHFRPTTHVYCSGALYWVPSPSFTNWTQHLRLIEQFQERRVWRTGLKHRRQSWRAHLTVLRENVAFVIHYPTGQQGFRKSGC
ncbi:hypothetical protein IFM89_020068 [Coptis chinensis]|uniref:F-box associated beta-propeller type 3 domain-containing protein n=1 Tax=Coptis chinensis TaxID=261450 RepID=A0A835H5M4_9MAGN|nr:hypothetical protein IFM89_020068 [Coptis chinensis]